MIGHQAPGYDLDMRKQMISYEPKEGKGIINQYEK